MSKVPAGWKRDLLENVAEIRTGVAKGKKGLKDPITVPYLRVANVQDGYLDLTEIKEIEIERHQLERYSLKKGDVLMNEGGDFDKLGRGDIWQGQISPCLNQNHVFAVRPDQGIISSYFLAALASSYHGKNYFLSCAKRSTNLASINSTQLKKFPVIIPPLPEQTKIAQILSTWDKAITTTEQLVGNSQQQKKSLMQSLLTGKKRLPGFAEIWEIVSVDSVCNVGRGRVICKGDIQDNSGKFPVYSSQTSNDGIFGYINTFDFEGDYVTWTTDGVYAGSIFYRSGKFNCTNVCGVLSPKGNNLDLKYLSFALSTIAYKYVSHTLANPKLMNGVMGGIKFKLPPLPEQQKIAAVLTAADNEIELLQKKLAFLKQEKAALMQQLLTGKRRVKVETA